MEIRLLIVYIISRKVYAAIFSEMIMDYFDHKEVSNVVGFSCHDSRENLIIVKKFSEKNIKATMYEFDKKSIRAIFENVNYWRIGIFLDCRCYDEDIIISGLLETTKYRMYDELYHWLIINNDLKRTLNFINDEAFGLSTDVVLAILTDTENYDLYDIYNTFKDRGGLMNVTFFGNWNNRSNLNNILDQPKFNRRTNLHGLNLKVLFFKSQYRKSNETLESFLKSEKEPTKDGRSKFGYHIVVHLSEMYNFSFECQESLNWESGDKLGPVARALADYTTDIAGSPLSLSHSRTYLLKYVHQDWLFRTCFIFRSPQITNIKMEEIFRPLADVIWYTMSAFLICSISLLTLALYFDCREANLSTISDSAVIIIGSLCQQATDVKMTRLSTRILFLCMMLYSVLIYNYYSASVVSARLNEPIYKINDSLNEFTKMNMKFASEWMVYLEYFIRSTDWETQQFYNKLWLKLPESKRFMSTDVGVKLVKEGGFAYHLHPEIVYEAIERTYSNREICELMEVHLARPAVTAFAVPLNSSIVELMRIGLTKLTEVGLRSRQVSRSRYKKPRCRKDILEAASVTIYEILAHLILLLTGAGLSLVICISEFMIEKYNLCRRSKITIILNKKCNV